MAARLILYIETTGRNDRRRDETHGKQHVTGALRKMAKKKKNPVEVYQMICGSCQSRNYVTRLKRENKSLEVQKYCPAERKHTPHKAKKA